MLFILKLSMGLNLSLNLNLNNYISLLYCPPTENKAFVTLTGTTPNWTYSISYNAYLELGASNATLSINGATNGDYGLLRIKQTQGPTASFLTLPANSVEPFGTYSFTSGTNSIDIYTFYFDGTNDYIRVFVSRNCSFNY